MRDRSDLHEPEFLTGFRSETVSRARRYTARAALYAALVFPFFLFVDWMMYPQYVRQFLLIRATVVAVSLVVVGLTATPLGQRIPRGLGVFEYLVCCLAIVVMVHLTDGYQSPYYAGVNLVLIAFLFILPLDVVRTSITCIIIYLTYIIPILVQGGIRDLAIFTNNNFFLFFTMVLVTMSSYLATRMRLHEYTARYRLAIANSNLKELDLLKSQFFANVSHEVRTPLTSIVSPIQTLYQGDMGELTPDQHQLVSQVYRNGLRLLDMINQMLDFAKYDARKMDLRLSWVDLVEVAEEMVSVFGEACRRKNVELILNADESIPGAYLDQDKMERILSNLIRNAVKFTDRGSITVSVSARPGDLVITVVDTGIGIPSERLSIIFERFRQVDGSSTRRYEGTGLGLAIVKEAVALQQGRIDVESVHGQGTTFTIHLPDNLDVLAPDAFIERRDQRERRRQRNGFDGPDKRKGLRRRRDITQVGADELAFVETQTVLSVNTDAMEVRAPRADAGSITVLYVEDNADLRIFVSKMLSHHGYTVLTARDGEEGWNALLLAPPDVVVSDLMMPKLDGFELLTRIRRHEHLAGLPVILITAKSEVESRIEGLNIGADDYLAKPINIRELDARIRNLIHLRRLKASEIRAEQLEERIEELSLSFARTLELRDQYTAGHSHDVLTYGTIIAEEMGIAMNTTLREALLLHDIGKLGIPDSILLKEGPLNTTEWEVMKSHAELGASLLRVFDSFRAVSNIILAHQEHYDGSGYPNGLQRDQIPLEARIISVADSWHAMTEDRPYRKALSGVHAVSELKRNRGRQFDPDVVDAFLRALIRKKLIEESVVLRAPGNPD